MQMLSVWVGVGVVCLAGIVVALVALVRTQDEAPGAKLAGVEKAAAKLDSAPTIGA